MKELDEGAEEIKQDTSLIGRVKQLALNRLGNLGFFGIMLFASIPNPLFDLAGLTCGRILQKNIGCFFVPFFLFPFSFFFLFYFYFILFIFFWFRGSNCFSGPWAFEWKFL